MSVSPHRQWQHFKDMPSGRRFQTRHRLRRAQKGGLLRKIVFTTAGSLLILVGMTMLVLPGPGLLAILLGAALIAEESVIAARLLDRADVWGSGLWQRWRKWRAVRRSRG
jgi:hypothetical protein